MTSAKSEKPGREEQVRRERLLPRRRTDAGPGRSAAALRPRRPVEAVLLEEAVDLLRRVGQRLLDRLVSVERLRDLRLEDLVDLRPLRRRRPRLRGRDLLQVGRVVRVDLDELFVDDFSTGIWPARAICVCANEWSMNRMNSSAAVLFFDDLVMTMSSPPTTLTLPPGTGRNGRARRAGVLVGGREDRERSTGPSRIDVYLLLRAGRRRCRGRRSSRRRCSASAPAL